MANLHKKVQLLDDFFGLGAWTGVKKKTVPAERAPRGMCVWRRRSTHTATVCVPFSFLFSLLRLLYTRRGPSPVHRCHHFSLFLFGHIQNIAFVS